MKFTIFNQDLIIQYFDSNFEFKIYNLSEASVYKVVYKYIKMWISLVLYKNLNNKGRLAGRAGGWEWDDDSTFGARPAWGLL